MNIRSALLEGPRFHFILFLFPLLARVFFFGKTKEGEEDFVPVACFPKSIKIPRSSHEEEKRQRDSTGRVFLFSSGVGSTTESAPSST